MSGGPLFLPKFSLYQPLVPDHVYSPFCNVNHKCIRYIRYYWIVIRSILVLVEGRFMRINTYSQSTFESHFVKLLYQFTTNGECGVSIPKPTGCSLIWFTGMNHGKAATTAALQISLSVCLIISHVSIVQSSFPI